ncbi:MAG: hypothetical protein BRC53_07880 [Cyanobacteria bacterium SW_6_48_11]|nr:MAG: hypothetical protein BRC53_07880 [Cyanobacteria bacterium SW_6_48_11]
MLDQKAPAVPTNLHRCGMTLIKSEHSHVIVVGLVMMLLEPLRNHVVVLLQQQFIIPGAFLLP